MLLHLNNVELRGGYRLFLSFSNGVSGEVDLSQELWGEMFEPLRDEDLFRSAKLDPIMRTVCWSNGADFAPEFLLDCLSKQTKVAA
jgi:hypothetical protein